jgi:hypothetical protein
LQFAPAARVVPQLLRLMKFDALTPPSTMLAILSVAVPVLVIVTDCGALRTLGVEENVRLLAESVTAGAMPVPVRLTACGEPATLSVTEMAAVSVPVAVGVKVT